MAATAIAEETIVATDPTRLLGRNRPLKGNTELMPGKELSPGIIFL
jgi:hypothetical protein